MTIVGVRVEGSKGFANEVNGTRCKVYDNLDCSESLRVRRAADDKRWRGYPSVFRIVLLIFLLIKAEATSLAEGNGDHSCALHLDGRVVCWGYNAYGQLGDGTVINRAYPVYVLGDMNVSSISVGKMHSCALLTDGTIKCWGNGGYGRLGNGLSSSSSQPVLVSGITNAVSVASGREHTCAILTGGSVKCWGFNNVGQVGDGTILHRSVPEDVLYIGTTTSPATSIALGFHSCALLTNGEVMCWGHNWKGQLGSGAPYSYSDPNPPQKVFGISTAASIELGERHTCVLLTDKTIKCWGFNHAGQLGDETLADSNVPVDVPSITDAESISLGASHSCALLKNSSIMCWGENLKGQLGDGTTANKNTPVEVVGITTTPAKIAMGWAHSCAWSLAKAKIMCWGDNQYRQLGNGTSDFSLTPLEVVGHFPGPPPLRPCTCCERSMKSFGFSVGAEDCDPEL